MGAILDESDFPDSDFHHLRLLVLNHSGIALAETKKAMVCRRLSSRLRELHLDSLQDYLALLASEPEEIPHCINAISTNMTYFFREAHHFEFLSRLLLAPGGRRAWRIWSAGCATGEEPYSIAMVAGETDMSDRVHIEATDINSQALELARAGVYRAESVSGVSPERLKRWFWRGKGSQAGKVRVRAELSERIHFHQLNLQRDWDLNGSFHVIFCRNVLIYFNRPAQRRLFERFADLLEPGGYLFVGHSESLHGMIDQFKGLGKCIYQKLAS